MLKSILNYGRLINKNKEMKTVTRTEASKADKTYRDMLKTEKHHKHEIVKENGVLRWKQNPQVNKIIDEKIDLNELWKLFYFLGYGKNSEVVRKLYRDMGYSLFGYWEVFYWEANNDIADEYVPNSDCVGKN